MGLLGNDQRIHMTRSDELLRVAEKGRVIGRQQDASAAVVKLMRELALGIERHVEPLARLLGRLAPVILRQDIVAQSALHMLDQRRDVEVADQDHRVLRLPVLPEPVGHLVDEGELVRELGILLRVGDVAARGDVEVMDLDAADADGQVPRVTLLAPVRSVDPLSTTITSSTNAGMRVSTRSMPCSSFKHGMITVIFCSLYIPAASP